MRKVETVEEYIARGGNITKCPIVEAIEKEQNVKSIITGPVTFLSLEEAELMFGEKTTRKKKEKPVDLTNIKVDAVPEDLRKFLGI